ncbi:hypothetical protein DVH24_013942, partial [Malus domestica]
GQLLPDAIREITYQIAKGQSKEGSTFQPKKGSKFQAKNGKFQPICASRTTTQLWENDELKAFPIFPSGVKYMPEKLKDKSKFPIFLQNFPEEKSTSNLACKLDDVFPKPRKKHVVFFCNKNQQKKEK